MFSIVVPLWNKRPTIRATVASALAQSLDAFELIIVDDGSTDGGMAALAGIADARVRRILQANAGPGPARNRGMAAARYDWIAFLDADDIWLPDHLAELDRLRRRFPEAGLIGAAYKCSDPKGGWSAPESGPRRLETIDYFDRVAARGWPFCTSSVAVPIRSYRELGGFCDAPVAQDSEYWARIALDRPVAVSSRVTAVYRLGTGGISDTARSLWYGRPLRRPRDLGPSVALLLDRRAGIRSPALRAAVDRYIDGRFRLCVRRSARLGDLATLRAVPALFLRPPEPTERIILALARLPRPLATALYAAGFALKALLRRLGKARSRLSLRRAAPAALAPPILEALAE
jgi:glycosyltransferase involved in cell wall biosynthesis